MVASEQLIAFLKEREGFQPQLYCDAAGHCTIGYGHLVHLGKLGDAPRREAPFELGITEAHADALLRKDVAIAEWALQNFVTVPLTQGQFDALTSFVYNVGPGAFEESTLRRVVNDRLYDAVPHELAKWNHVHKVANAGLTKRRLAEIVMWNDARA